MEEERKARRERKALEVKESPKESKAGQRMEARKEERKVAAKVQAEKGKVHPMDLKDASIATSRDT